LQRFAVVTLERPPSPGPSRRPGAASRAPLADEIASAPRAAVREVKRCVLREAGGTWDPLLEEETRALRAAVLQLKRAMHDPSRRASGERDATGHREQPSGERRAKE
jgi:hypothetical protein